jgi:hypothetical protein
MRLALLFSFLVLCSPCVAEDAVRAILIEPEAVSQKENFTWNKWETENFIIMSIEKDQGLSLKGSVESLKDEHSERWGLERAGLKAKCKVVCVRDAEMLKRFFGVDSPRAETRRDSSGKILTSAIWVDFKRIQELPSLVAFICVSDGSLGDNRLYVQRGISLLSLPSERVKSELKQSGKLDFAEVSSLSSEKWFDLSSQDRALFDRRSALICLMLRKEFGEERFLKFLLGTQDQNSVRSVYGFRDAAEFNSTLNRYSENLSKDIGEGITPDSYVTVKGAKK